MASAGTGENHEGGALKNLAAGVVRQAGYCYGFNTLVEDLDNEQDMLISTKGSMEAQVGKAIAKTQVPSGDVQKRLEEAADLLIKAETLKGKAEARKNCCNAFFPNWICRCIIGKKAAGLTEEMKQLSEKLELKLLPAHRLSLRPMRMPEDLCESRKEILNKLLMALKIDQNIRIGLHGMAGCGKTCLLRVVQESVKDLELFDKVAYADVSNPPNISAIQQGIAGWLDLKFETEKTDDTRAARLCMNFAEDKRYLIILDNMWEVLDFKVIGIPSTKNCKVLLSSRLENTCTLMGCEEVIHLSLLTDGEARNLFRCQASVTEDIFDVVAQEIADECHRLPFAIKAVACTLKGKPLSAWKKALITLKDRTPLDIDWRLQSAYACLKLSIDHLEDKVRSLFFLCALFPKDSKIDLQDLIRFAFGLSIFEGPSDTYENARSKVGEAVDKIKKCCLLLDVEEGEIVEMHDLVREVALWRTNKETQVIMGPRQKLKAFMKLDFMNDTRRLYCHNTREFPGQLNCPKLEILFVTIDGGCSSKKGLPDTFFNETLELKVLVIKDTSLWTDSYLLLPRSIEELRKLRTLCLRGWILNNISILGKLGMLGTIQLLNCMMKKLPDELTELRMLKLLEISGCRIGGNPVEVLGRCSHLEELYFVENTLDMVSNDQDVVKLFHQIGHSTVMQRYHLQIGSCIDTSKNELMSKFISINNFSSSTTKEIIQILSQKLELLFLEKIKGDCKSIIPEVIPLEGEGMIELTEILLRDIDNLECLIDSTDHQLYQATTVFSKLLRLKIEKMKCLKALCRSSHPCSLFKNLKELFIFQCNRLVSIGKLELFNLKFLELEDCRKLTSLFTTGAAQKMVLLEVLKVTNCSKLKHIIEDETDADVMSKLKQVSIKGCDHLECIIPTLVTGGLSQLESLEITDARMLKHVFGKCSHEVDRNQIQSIDFPVLKVFKLIDLPNIISICPQNYLVTCRSLDEPHIVGCAKWSGMFNLDSEVRQKGGGISTKQAKLLSMLNFQVGTVKHLLQAATGQARFNTLVIDLGKEKDKLISTRETILVNASNIEKPSVDLLQQLEEANDLIKEVEKLESEAEATKTYCRGFCHRYNVSKDLVRMTDLVKQLEKRLASNSLRSTVTDICSENFFFFASRKLALDELLMALKDDGINMIGLYGRGPCGKTSLALEICKVAEHLKLFDKVVFVMVSRYPKVSIIQDEISCSLGFRFCTEERVPERAARLSRSLNNGVKFLIVLDDIWEKLNLEDIGIPRDKNCKLIVTAREHHICALMDCRREIFLSHLTQEEAWTLFKTQLRGIEDEDVLINKIAQEVRAKFSRLPLTIIAVARSMRSNPEIWLKTLQAMKYVKMDDHDKWLELCIRPLTDTKVSLLFFLCVFFPKNSNIALEMLVRFAFGLGIFEGFESYENTRSEVVTAISKLKDLCLLSLAKEGRCINVHDLVHDVALSMAKDIQLVKNLPDLKDLTDMKARKDTKRLYCHDINVFPYVLHCPKLDILFVSTDGECTTKIPSGFFWTLIELKVLAIINTSLWRITDLLLPQSIVELKMLRTLCLRGMKLDNIFLLGKLEMLDTLELAYCEINKLPKELVKLRKLKLLEVSRSRIKNNPFEVLARCSQLEELYFIENDLPEMMSNDQNVIELLHQIGSSEVLQRYHLQIGSVIDTSKDDSKSKFISLSDFDVSISNEVIKDLTQELEVLFLKEVRGDYKNIIPDMIPIEEECMNELIEFLLCHCDSIECLIDTTNLHLYHATTVFSRLLKLKLKTMRHLEALCRGRPPSGLFKKLEELFILECSQLRCVVSVGKLNLCSLRCLQLEDCPNLTFLFTYSTAQTMLLLEVLKVRGCTALKHILKDEMEEDDIICAGPVFPKLKQVRVWRCDHLEYIIPASFAGGLSQLESLEIEDARELKHVFGNYNHEEYQNPGQSICLPALKVFKLINLPNISSTCPQHYDITWPSLDGPLIRGCPLLRTGSMFDLDSEVREQGDDKAEKQELVLPPINKESNSVPGGSQQEYERPVVLSPSTDVTTTSPTIEPPASSSANQHPSAEELVDFHGLFKIKARHARLLEEAFAKYPHLQEWKLSQKTLRICKVGYESLADMLAFLKSETPKAMDDLKRKELENLYFELEYFGFDKEWLASIRQRVMDMQVDHNDKLKRLVNLESQKSTLEKQLSDARASLASMKEDLSKLGDVFGF